MKITSKIISLFATLILLSVAPAVFGGGYYTWKDENGVTHFARTPPPDVNTESRSFGVKRDIHTPYVTPAPAPTPPQAEQAPEAEQPAATETAAAPEIYAKDPARCEQARANLQTLQSERPIRATAADGSKSLLTPEQRQQQRDLAMEVINIHC